MRGRSVRRLSDACRGATTEALGGLGRCRSHRRQHGRPRGPGDRWRRRIRADSRSRGRTGGRRGGRTVGYPSQDPGVSSIAAAARCAVGRVSGSRCCEPQLARLGLSRGRSSSRRCAKRWDRQGSQRSHRGVVRPGVPRGNGTALSITRSAAASRHGVLRGERCQSVYRLRMAACRSMRLTVGPCPGVTRRANGARPGYRHRRDRGSVMCTLEPVRFDRALEAAPQSLLARLEGWALSSRRGDVARRC